jgi:hypothetical protein
MTELDQIVTQIKQSTDYQINKKILKEKMETDLHIPYNGGMFKVTPELIAFLECWNSELEVILEDVYENPIIVNQYEFLTLCKQHYKKIMNMWWIKHAQLKQVRKI